MIQYKHHKASRKKSDDLNSIRSFGNYVTIFQFVRFTLISLSDLRRRVFGVAAQSET